VWREGSWNLGGARGWLAPEFETGSVPGCACQTRVGITYGELRAGQEALVQMIEAAHRSGNAWSVSLNVCVRGAVWRVLRSVHSVGGVLE